MFVRRIETNKFQKYSFTKISLISSGFDTPVATTAQGYSTTEA